MSARTQRRAALAWGLVCLLACTSAALAALLAWRRFATYHNETFDLAFYTRLAWGFPHGDLYEPIVGGLFFGLHLSWILAPLGLLGVVFGTAKVLIVAQSVALAAAAIPLAKIAGLQGGPLAAVVGALLYLLQPNLWHVATFEVHPGSIALAPMAWLLLAAYRGDVRLFGWSALGLLACREDLALTIAAAALLAFRSPAACSKCDGAGPRSNVQCKPAAQRRVHRWAVAALVYFAAFVFVLLPLFGPEQGSLEAHFGGVTRDPLAFAGRRLGALLSAEHLAYLPKVLIGFAGLPLLAPRLAAVALPTLLVNLASGFPGTLGIESHYLSPALPPLTAASIVGYSRLMRWLPILASRSKSRRVAMAIRVTATAAIAMTVLAVHIRHSAAPWAMAHQARDFRADARSHAARAVLRAIDPDTAVQAPDELLPHLAERPRLFRAPPPERLAKWVVLRADHRLLFAHYEDLLRTQEEPIVRRWLARPDFGLVRAEGPYLLLQRGVQARQALAKRYFRGSHPPIATGRVTACISVVRATAGLHTVELEVVAHRPCASDLALRLGDHPYPNQTDLLCDGLLSPARLQRGDWFVSRHRFDRAAGLRTLWVGALRSSGARVNPEDPHTVAIAVGRKSP